MANRSAKQFIQYIYKAESLIKKRKESYRGVFYNVINRFQSHLAESDKIETEQGNKAKDTPPISIGTTNQRKGFHDAEIDRYSSGNEYLNDKKWSLELAWLTKAIEPALQFCRRALPTGIDGGMKLPPNSRSLAEIIASIQRSKIGIEDWTLSDLTVGLYLIYLRQTSLNPLEDITGVEVLSEPIVHDLIYHAELAKGCYRDSISSLARNIMVRESNVLKFVKDSNVMRPGYYVGIDHRKKLVIFGIRGTHTVYDLITDIVSSSDGEVTYEGYSTHFGTAEAARWFLSHELGTIRKCLEKHEGYKLRLVGHSLGGATASLLAIMLRTKSHEELGFCPDIVSAVGYATPPCVSKELAERCSQFVTTVVMQHDVVPRLSTASLARLRNEVLKTDWMSVIEKEDQRRIIELVTNAKQVVSSVQDVAKKLADYANFRIKKDTDPVPLNSDSRATSKDSPGGQKEAEHSLQEELYVPGTVYYLKRNVNKESKANSGRGAEYHTLWKRHQGQHFQRILLSGNFISDHKCDSHYYALRDVLKGLPGFIDEEIFRSDK